MSAKNQKWYEGDEIQATSSAKHVDLAFKTRLGLLERAHSFLGRKGVDIDPAHAFLLLVICIHVLLQMCSALNNPPKQGHS